MGTKVPSSAVAPSGTAKVAVKPPYVGLLNAIAVGEGRGGALLDAWAASTPDPALSEVLAFVACREHDHAELFAARLCELGYEVRPTEDPAFEGRLGLLSSGAPDAEKLACFEDLGRREEPKGGSKPATRLDAVTSALVDWFALEEADSGRRLREAFAPLRADAPAGELDGCAKLFADIAAGEGVGGLVLAAWAEATDDAALCETLTLVAARETNHARVFGGRLEELGLEAKAKKGKKVEAAVAFYASDAPDCEKAAKAIGSVQDLSGLDRLCERAQSFPTVERHLISWFIGEERDSSARLLAAYESVLATT